MSQCYKLVILNVQNYFLSVHREKGKGEGGGEAVRACSLHNRKLRRNENVPAAKDVGDVFNSEDEKRSEVATESVSFT